MKIIIAGGKDFDNYNMVEQTMKNLDLLVTEIVCGYAQGADRLGEKWAINNGIKVTYFPADWDNYGTSAGFIRNAEMAEYADYLVAFWDMKSSGTKHMIETMKKCGKHGTVVPYENTTVFDIR